MDFSILFQLRNKKYWWVNIIFYFVLALLVAMVFSYFIFLFKNGMISAQIKEQETKLKELGTSLQKEHEKEVLIYQKKINDFETLLKNHEFASNIFSFMQAQTMPNIWFSQFGLDQKGRSLQLTGIADSMDALSRQVDILEKNKYIKDLRSFTSSLGESARTNFNLSVALDDKIFAYLSDISPNSASTTPDQEPTNDNNQVNGQDDLNANNSDIVPNNSSMSPEGFEKQITSFNIMADPEIVGIIDQDNYKINITVPFGTDTTKLSPKIIISPEATILPESFAIQDFTNPVMYKVTAKDGTTQNYEAVVTIAPEVKSEKKDLGNIIILITSIVSVVMIIIAGILVFLKKRKGQKNNNGIGNNGL